MNRCVVSSSSEYIAVIETNNLFNYISRGENKQYEYPLRSSIYRNYFEHYSKMLDNYHLDVENSINPIQDKNFLAFAQHHRIPTNLLDFSFSPLVSLYFSTDRCTDKGFVYFVDRSRTVNINNVIYDKPLGWGLFDDLLSYDLNLYKKILPQMSEAFITNREKIINYFENHAEMFIQEFRRIRARSYLDSLEGGVDDFESALKKYREDKIKWQADDNIKEDITLQIYDSIPNFLNGMERVFADDIKYPESFFINYQNITQAKIPEAKYSANIHALIFLLKMEEIEYCYNRVFSTSNLRFELEFPFYFTYHPPIIDDRIRNQSSVFIFQPFSTNNYHTSTGYVQVWQKIAPDFTIEIQNPELIRKELDAIGINLKHIYCDYDSIANYTVSSIQQSIP